MRRKKDPTDLTFLEYLLLLVLPPAGDGDRGVAGWDIWNAIRERAELEVASSTMYAAIARLHSDHLIEIDHVDDSAVPGQKKFLVITGAGAHALDLHGRKLAAAAALARDLKPRPAPAGA